MLFRRTRHQARHRTRTRGRDVLDVTAHVDRRGPAVALRVNDAEPVLLTPFQVGQLRAQLREAVQQAGVLAEQLERAAVEPA